MKEKKRILIIEDEKALQEVLRDRLIEEGFEVMEALDGDEGIRKMQEFTPDLLLLDIILPRKDGFFVLNALRKKDIKKHIPIIVITNLADEPNLEKIQSYFLDSDHCLVKSDTSLAEIIEFIKKTLTHKS